MLQLLHHETEQPMNKTHFSSEHDSDQEITKSLKWVLKNNTFTLFTKTEPGQFWEIIDRIAVVLICCFIPRAQR